MQHVLKKESFTKVIDILALKVPSKECSKIRTEYKDYILRIKKISPIVDDGDSKTTKLILLNSKFKNINELPKEIQKLEIKNYNLKIGYDHLDSHTILREILPKEIKEVPSSFESVGHIAHLNLNNELLPFKKSIGEVILDKNPAIKTVINKEGIIDSTFREFKMELISGLNKFDVDLKEHGIRFKFNYSEVYWNSRLSTEHQRLLKYFKKTDIVCDMFAGIGPFVLPVAKKVQCKCYANDLNPNSFKYLKQNSKLNKVENYINCYNLDGREFVKSLIENDIKFNHVIMNLPKTAVEFLDVFVNLLPNSYEKVMIHCYSFSSKENGENLLKEEIEKILGNEIEYIEIYNVRDISPNKYMFCASFILPKSCYKNLKRNSEEIKKDESNSKKIKI
eukprot:gene8151-12612_t